MRKYIFIGIITMLFVTGSSFYFFIKFFPFRDSQNPTSQFKNIEITEDKKLIAGNISIQQDVHRSYGISNLYISLDGETITYPILKDGPDWFFGINVNDGEKGKLYNYRSGSLPTLAVSPNRKLTAFSARRQNENRQDSTSFIVVNGIEGKEYNSAYDPIFSPDSNTIAYIASESLGDKRKDFIVVNTREGEKYDDILDRDYAFSFDSKRIIYKAKKDQKTFLISESILESNDKIIVSLMGSDDSMSGDKNAIIINGKIGKIYDAIEHLEFGPDGKTLIYIAEEGGKDIVVINGHEGNKYAHIKKPSGYDIMKYGFYFNASNNTAAYLAKEKTENPDDLLFLIISDNQGKEIHKEIAQGDYFVISPDGQTVAYRGSRDYGRYSYMVVNGKKEKEYKFIPYNDSIFFSPDSQTIAYLVEESYGIAPPDRAPAKKVFMVINGKEGKKYKGYLHGSPIFSSDSKTVVYKIGTYDKKEMVIVNDKEMGEYDSVPSVIFSPDNEIIAYKAELNKKQFLVINGQEDKKYLIISDPVFLDNQTIAYGAYDGNNVYKITKKLK